jgi:hypothetical protein
VKPRVFLAALAVRLAEEAAMKRVCVSIVVITLVILLGGETLSCSGEPSYPWTLISPPDVDIVDMRAYGASDISFGLVLVLARTSDERILSTGIVKPEAIMGPEVEEWRWTDISGGHAWSDFPEIASWDISGRELWLLIKYEGNLYQVDASGQWQRAEPSDSDVTCKEDDIADMSRYKDVEPLAGEVVKVQRHRLGVEAPTLLFALVKGKGVFLCVRANRRPAFPICGAVVPLGVGCLLVWFLGWKSWHR